MNILVTGANGQLGRELRRLSKGTGPDRWLFTDICELPGEDTTLLDITDADAVRLVTESERVSVIVNCAAYTDVEKAEDNPGEAFELNCRAAGNLACAAASLGATLIHISTDFIFPGTGNIPLREDAPTGPLNVYGSTKLQGEEAVLHSGCRAIILRTAWLYSPYGRNFVKSIRHITALRDSIEVVYDQTGSPTSATDLAQLIRHIIASGQLSKTGIYNFTDEGAVSRYDFACCIRDLSGNTCDINPCLSSDYKSKARRPSYAVLDKSLVKRTFGFAVPDWQTSLREVISRLDSEPSAEGL